MDTDADRPNSQAVDGTEDPRAAFAAVADVAASVIEQVTPKQMDRATPCEGYDVDRMLAHLVMVARRVAAAGRGEPPMTWPQEDHLPEAHEYLGLWRQAATEATAAWSSPGVLERATALPWGTFPGANALATYVNEVIVHTWDLAQAVGCDPKWDPEVLAVADAAIRAQLPTADREPLWAAVKEQLPDGYPWEDPFGPAVEVPDDAPALDRLLAWNGRDPRP